VIRFLTVDDLLDVVDRLHGGQRQIRDLGLLASAAARPQTTVFGADAYPEFEDKAAALLHSIARNHLLADGNKRLAWIAVRLFFLANGRVLDAPEDDAFDLVMAVAAGRLDVPDIAAALQRWGS